MWRFFENARRKTVNTRPTFDDFRNDLTRALREQWQPMNARRAHIRRMDVDSLRAFVGKFCEDYRARLEK